MPERCRAYRPDHNGECLNCDEPIDAHVHADLEALYRRVLRAWEVILFDVDTMPPALVKAAILTCREELDIALKALEESAAPRATEEPTDA
jgi:hypothetical protein